MKKLKFLGVFVILAAMLSVLFAFTPAVNASANEITATEENEARVRGSAPYSGQNGTTATPDRFRSGTQTPNTTPNTTPNGVTPNTTPNATTPNTTTPGTPNRSATPGTQTPGTATLPNGVTPNTGIRRHGGAATGNDTAGYGRGTAGNTQGGADSYYNNYNTTNNYNRGYDMGRTYTTDMNRTDVNTNRTDSGVIYLSDTGTQTQTQSCEPEIRTIPFENGCVIILTYCGNGTAGTGINTLRGTGNATGYNGSSRLNTYGANSGLNTYGNGAGYNGGTGYGTGMGARGYGMNRGTGTAYGQTAPQNTNYGGVTR